MIQNTAYSMNCTIVKQSKKTTGLDRGKLSHFGDSTELISDREN